ncbi:hypothetical protein VNI00_001041 [Paramarasmius palmivorus]|uniref:Transcription initiation factor IIE subunit beta n=1 Tax=Paramarasmius palmivorus TaxID=297713 RepID=A0AAW0E9P9_9AGAR
MSKLAKDAAAFKSVLQRQDYTSWHSQPPPLGGSASVTSGSGSASASTAAAATAEGGEGETAKKKRPKSNVVYSQPADTGSGKEWSTQLVYAVDYLKTTHNPMRLQDLAIYTSTEVDTNPTLIEKLRSHERVQWDPKTDLYSYKHEFNFRNKAALLTEIQRQTTKAGGGGGGIPVRLLKESWKEAPAAIEELEASGDVLVTRTTKDGQLKMVFWNELKPSEENGGMSVEKEFSDLWHELKVPNEVDLLRQLQNEGLQATTSAAGAASAGKGVGPKKKGKRGGAPRQRQVRITNTHLKGEIDLSKDYTGPGK